MSHLTQPASPAPTPATCDRRADERAASAAHDRLDAKLHALGKLAGLTAMQVNQASLERCGDAFRYPATNPQRNEAYELATQLEATLPSHAGTALRTRAEVLIQLLDPAGGDRLTDVLRQARFLLGV